jgi:hypothetical protein
VFEGWCGDECSGWFKGGGRGVLCFVIGCRLWYMWMVVCGLWWLFIGDRKRVKGIGVGEGWVYVVGGV